MIQDSNSFKLQKISQQFKQIVIQLDKCLMDIPSNEGGELRRSLHDKLKTHKQQGTLSVAFVGQYSAGKSTLISALTGQRDIHIDADIATDKTTAYDWQGIKLIDTPGLFTDRPDHDDIGYEAIANSDILVFCLTHMLFDSITIENFKKLAYEQSYQWKMILLVNKLSAEAGDEDEKIVSYRQSLADALQPHSLSDFPLCFIDAKDYCDGIDEDDDFLTEISRVDTFVAILNQFVQKNAIASRLDTPIRIALSHIDDAQTLLLRDDGEDAAFFETLSRLSRRVNRERDRLRTQIKGIELKISSSISDEAETLIAAVGQEDIEPRIQAADLNLSRTYDQIAARLDDLFASAETSIKQTVQDELNGPLVQSFVAQLNFDPNLQANNPNTQHHFAKLNQQVAWLGRIGNQTGAKVVDSATRSVVATAGQGLLRAKDVAGSPLHGTVYEIGKTIGFKFKAWQAVNTAKGLGNAAKILGSLATHVSALN
ncbi:MAG: GTPase [Cyanobacteria bacterium P01_F01_bin.150]